MRLKRRSLPAMSDHPRFDGDAASSVCHVACSRKACAASATKAAPARVMARSTFESACALCGGQRLNDERLAAASVANPSKADTEVIVASHRVLVTRGARRFDGVWDFSKCRLSCGSAHRSKSLILRPSAAGHPGRRLRLLSCPPNWAVVPLLPRHALLHCLIIHKPAIARVPAPGLDRSPSWSAGETQL